MQRGLRGPESAIPAVQALDPRAPGNTAQDPALPPEDRRRQGHSTARMLLPPGKIFKVPASPGLGFPVPGGFHRLALAWLFAGSLSHLFLFYLFFSTFLPC